MRKNLQFQEVVKAILLLVVNKPVAFGWTNYTSSIVYMCGLTGLHGAQCRQHPLENITSSLTT
ncbi:hypothetical protein Prudu_005289 [Prunus dulcis]|uniref:Uncharacterized protein n=1 Tax=Prunus dulcis TaxID=3755 RepID=A0A4Y1QXB1_PRUDU|nr:hypothetical protein Prudu_005289 [Prunus dulcis]